MERAVGPWGSDLRGSEEREQLRGARTGLGSEHAEISQPDEFEHPPQEDDLEFKEEEDLAPGHEAPPTPQDLARPLKGKTRRHGWEREGSVLGKRCCYGDKYPEKSGQRVCSEEEQNFDQM
ncbi:hypothetical protein E5288_WYG014022 [Bos mutus]|uniref:Uncharacterized protein n=1 Tax=Bos mutus TaxID=72004 RepID=A0A6B0RPR6_9CETA|nr:hypothetical protein [Bos mutus]